MASRKELKSRAKECLKQYYWMAFIVSLVASMLGANRNGTSFNITIPSASTTATQATNGDINIGVILLFLFIFLFILSIAWFFFMAIQAFLCNVVEVGLCSYFVKSSIQKSDAGFAELFYGFSCGNYKNVVKVMFMQKLSIALWSLLLVIPGIVKTYEYAMVPYILAEDVNIDYKEALQRSKDMMYGHKFELWVLQLSFIGWTLLGLLACCIGTIFVLPYQNATYAEYYLELKEQYYR